MGTGEQSPFRREVDLPSSSKATSLLSEQLVPVRTGAQQVLKAMESEVQPS